MNTKCAHFLFVLIISSSIFASDEIKKELNLEKEEFEKWDVGVVSYPHKYSLALMRYFQQGEWTEVSLNRDLITKESILRESHGWASRVFSPIANPYKGKILSQDFFLGEKYFPDKLVTRVGASEWNREYSIVESSLWYIVKFTIPKEKKKTTDTLYTILEEFKALFSEGVRLAMLSRHSTNFTHVIIPGKILDFLSLLVFPTTTETQTDPDIDYIFSRILWYKDDVFIMLYKQTGQRGLDWGDPSLRKKLGYPQRNLCILN